MHRFTHPRHIYRALIIALLGAVALVPGVSAQDQPSEMSPEDVVEQVGPAVVTVINEQTMQDSIGTSQTIQTGAGTGFIIDPDGYIVTNWHVVTGGTSYSVILADGTEIEAELIGEDPRDDLALVKIDASAVPATVPLGDSNQLKPGQTVLAIGSPLGSFGNTVTMGIVSGLNRNQFGSGGQCQNYTDMIQHDAAINPGNSGGPLFNLHGEVVGVNTLGIPVERGVPVQGLFFAVPSNTVSEVVDEILTQGHISVPYIGIRTVELTPQIATLNDLPVDAGVYIDTVEPGSPAENAGLQQTDIITAIDNQPITPETTLSQRLADYDPGQTVELAVLRDGEEFSTNLTFGEVPQELFELCTLQDG